MTLDAGVCFRAMGGRGRRETFQISARACPLGAAHALYKLQSQAVTKSQQDPESGTGIVTLQVSNGRAAYSDFGSQLSSRLSLRDTLVPKHQNHLALEGIGLGRTRHAPSA